MKRNLVNDENKSYMSSYKSSIDTQFVFAQNKRDLFEKFLSKKMEEDQERDNEKALSSGQRLIEDCGLQNDSSNNI